MAGGGSSAKSAGAPAYAHTAGGGPTARSAGAPAYARTAGGGVGARSAGLPRVAKRSGRSMLLPAMVIKSISSALIEAQYEGSQTGHRRQAPQLEAEKHTEQDGGRRDLLKFLRVPLYPLSGHCHWAGCDTCHCHDFGSLVVRALESCQCGAPSLTAISVSCRDLTAN
jgi:hypothetical protein